MVLKLPEKDETLETLLELDGEVFPMDNGYWTKFDAYRVTPDKHIPHGIKYSITLHDSSNKRIIGFDNAHAVKPKKKKFGGRKVTWDHKHQEDKTAHYEYESAGQLLEDFWAEVDKFFEK